MKSESINELASALAKAQGEIETAAKNSENPHFRSRYADLASVWDACRGPLSKHGLSVVQTVGQDEAGFMLRTMLCHASGQWIESTMHLLLSKQDMQGLGSAVTYSRRYSLAAIVGVAQDDDDGNAAVGSPNAARSQSPAPVQHISPQGESIPSPTPQRLQSVSPACCGGNMLVSKYNPNELYCPKCKAKAPRSA